MRWLWAVGPGLWAGCGVSEPLGLVPVSDSLQGVSMSLQVPEGVEGSASEASWSLRGAALGGTVEVVVLRHPGTPDVLEGAVRRVRRVFTDDRMVRDEADGDQWRLSHHAESGGSAGVHRLMPWTTDLVECWAATRGISDVELAVDLGERICDSLQLDAHVGIAPDLAEPGLGPAPMPPLRAREGPYSVELTVASGSELQTEVSVLLEIVASTWGDGGVLRTVTVGEVKVVRHDRSDALVGYGDAPALQDASGRTVRLWFTGDGQLQQRRISQGPPSQLVDQVHDILVRATATRPAIAVGQGATWTVVEPIDAYGVAPAGGQRVSTRYTLVRHDPAGVVLQRQPQLHAPEGVSQQVEIEAFFTDDVLPQSAEGASDVELTLPGAEPIHMRTRWTWAVRAPTPG